MTSDASDEPLDAADARIRAQSYAAMSDHVGLLDSLLLHINHGLSTMTGEQNDRGLNFLVMLLGNRAFTSLWRAREDALCGYPVQSLTLCRSAMEDWGTIYYVELHPDDIGVWLRRLLPEFAEAEGRTPKFSTIWKAISAHLGTDRATEVYGILSLFAHPRDGGLPWLYHFDPEQTYFHSAGHFSSRALEMRLYFLITVAQMLLNRIANLQARVTGAPEESWLNKGLALSERALSFLTGIENQLRADIDTSELHAGIDDE